MVCPGFFAFQDVNIAVVDGSADLVEVVAQLFHSGDSLTQNHGSGKCRCW
jgi:hypothetical protein